jgi:predicted dithiol-disulfide oxidoreductase (DUF899 family)
VATVSAACREYTRLGVRQTQGTVEARARRLKEKATMRARDALAAERRRMPWMAIEKPYEFDGPKGKVSLLNLFEDRRQLIVYRAFFEPGVFGWPEHACRGCSLRADQVSHLAHLNARNTTLAYVSRQLLCLVTLLQGNDLRGRTAAKLQVGGHDTWMVTGPASRTDCPRRGP